MLSCWFYYQVPIFRSFLLGRRYESKYFRRSLSAIPNMIIEKAIFVNKLFAWERLSSLISIFPQRRHIFTCWSDTKRKFQQCKKYRGTIANYVIHYGK